MSDRLIVKIITPEKVVFYHEADSILLPGTLGEMEVLPGHVAIFSTIEPGSVIARDGKRTLNVACGTGLLEVKDNMVSLLVDSAVGCSEIDPEAARRLIEEAEDKLKNLENEDAETRYAFETQLATAKARIEVFEKNKDNKGDYEAQEGFSRYVMPPVEKKAAESGGTTDNP